MKNIVIIILISGSMLISFSCAKNETAAPNKPEALYKGNAGDYYRYWYCLKGSLKYVDVGFGEIPKLPKNATKACFDAATGKYYCCE